ncbi:MAG: SusC/RagA family TonB-linked outer membrane protein [Bacteroidales bacterium]|nr:SusC/RagA family TonB-linked outer membrane protein [Bacteroidales bacterium]
MEKRLSMFLASLFLCVGMAVAQVQVKGTIISADDGQPLPGASIKVLGTKTGTVTDINGDFVISVPNNDTRLEISHMGMLPRVVKARNGMRISLDTDNQLLDEVMVIGYGTTKRSTFTGSAVEIKSEEITNHVAATATSALVGKVAGIQATGVGAGPGSAPTIRIRGFGSFNADDTPLYVIDGVPMVQGLATVNPNDIESMSVLKDASATAIYGSRGANGVILITTKKARGKQDAEVTFDAKWGSNSRLVPNYDVITDPAQYYETQYRSLYNWRTMNLGESAAEAYAFANANIFDGSNGGLGYQVYTVPEGQNLIGTNFRLNPNATLGYSDGEYYYTPDNWYDETYHNSFRQEYNASVSGGTDRLSYYAGVGYLNDAGFVDNSKYERYTGRTNVEYRAKKWLTLNTNMSFTHGISESPYYTTTYGSSGNLFYITNNIGPIYPLYVRNADGSLRKENGIQIYDSNQTNFSRPAIVGNAVRDNVYDKSRGYSDVFNGMWKATITPIEGLNISAQLAAQDINSRSNDLYSRFGSAAAYDGSASASHSRAFDINQQYIANYTKTIADVHNIGIMVGYEQEKRLSQSISGSNDHLFNPYVGELNNALAHKNESVGSSTDRLMRQGIIGRVSYDYGERYFVDADFRRGASSIFAPDHRWGNFGGFGLGWQINKESFMKDIEWVDLLKAKVSFGANGNDNMGWHAYADTYAPSYNEETGEYSVALSSKGNEELTWEKKKMWNFGLDFSLFKYRLNGTLEVYTGRTTDLLYTKYLPLSSGINARTYPANVGTLLNRGVEFSLNGDIIRTKDIKWNMNVALGHNHNEFLELDPADEAAGGIKYSNSIIRVGGSVTEAYMLEYAGTYNGSYTGNDFAVNKWDYNFQDGQALYWMDEVQMKVVQTEKLDDAGNPVVDADGNAVMVDKVDANGNPVYEEVLDKNGDPVLTGKRVVTNTQDNATKYDLGDIQPKVIGGFGTTFEAFGFDLSAQFSFQLGGKTYDGAYHQLMHNGRSQGQAMHKDLLDAWSAENTSSDIPRMSYGDTEATSQTAYSRFRTSSNDLSLDNLAVGYTFPK